MGCSKIAAEPLDSQVVIHVRHRRGDLGAELVALDTGSFQQPAIAAEQSVDPLADQRLDMRWERVPVDHIACSPAPISIPAQPATLGQRVEHLDREQGVPFRVLVEGGAEGLVEAIWGCGQAGRL